MRLYFYCMFMGNKNCKTTGITGLGSQKVFHIYNNDLYAAVSVTKYSFFDKSDENLKIHENIIRYYDNNFNILPFRFNTIIGEKIGKGILFKFYEELLSNLKKVNKRFQYDLKVFKKPPLEAELGGNYSPVNPAQLREKISDIKTKYLVSQINGPLLKIAKDLKIDRLVTNNLILSGKYLVNQKDSEKFEKELKRMQSIFSEYTFISKAAEPPYEFVEVEITKDNVFIK
ncbi:GvpL/GvpF family gas vesicle protein [candidate division KSB1 bacterium]